MTYTWKDYRLSRSMRVSMRTLTPMEKILRDQAKVPVLRSHPTPKGLAMEWQPIETLPPPGERPGRVFVVVQGYQTHSGYTWLRQRQGIARTNNDGFYDEDIMSIEMEGHMDLASGHVTHWLPWCLPCMPEPV